MELTGYYGYYRKKMFFSHFCPLSVYNPRVQILPVKYQKSSLLDKGSALTFLVPDMVASMVHAMDHLTRGPGFNVDTLTT